MTPQERSMVEDLVRKLQETKLTEKDPEAEQLLRERLAGDPDAIYKMAQTVLVQNLALNQAQMQIRQMKQTQQQAQPAHSTSFLGNLLGHRDPAPPAPQPQYQQVQAPAYQTPPQNIAAPPYAAPGSSPAGSFLRSAATTAAGVAAGALAFEGIESLIHGSAFGGREWGSFSSGAAPVEETVINNYYENPQQAGGFGEHHERRAAYDEEGPDGQAELEDANYQPDNDPTSFDDLQTGDSDSDFGDDDGSDFS